MDRYSIPDALFDEEARGVERCPKHGLAPCACCRVCGGEGTHPAWCSECPVDHPAVVAIQAAREELARQQNIARIRELKLLILANERALPKLSGIPLRHASKRIVDGRAELATCELLERLERERDEDVTAGRWSEAPLDLATLSDGATS